MELKTIPPIKCNFQAPNGQLRKAQKIRAAGQEYGNSIYSCPDSCEPAVAANISANTESNIMSEETSGLLIPAATENLSTEETKFAQSAVMARILDIETGIQNIGNDRLNMIAYEDRE